MAGKNLIRIGKLTMQQLKNELIELVKTADASGLWQIAELLELPDVHKRYHKRSGVVYRLTELTEIDPADIMKISPSEQEKPDTARDVTVTYQGVEINAWWYFRDSEDREHWKLRDLCGTKLYGSDIALVTSWREIE